MEEATSGAAPCGKARQQVLADGVVVVVDGDAGAQDFLGEREAGFFVAFFVAALVPHVVVLWLVWKEIVKIVIDSQIRPTSFTPL